VNRQLARRAIREVPSERVHPRWGWDLARTLAAMSGAGAGLQDELWERAEHSLDRYCARVLADPAVDGFLGVEFGALSALTEARRQSKVGLVAFLSPHHATRRRWLEPELDAWPQAQTPTDRKLAALSVARDARRDEEAAMADWIITGSSFTSKSLVDAGHPAAKMLTIPLGGPPPVPVSALPNRPAGVTRVVFAGSVALHKGAHHLIEAWQRLAPRGAELHFYGKVLLPQAMIEAVRRKTAGSSIAFHGLIPASDLRAAYLDASVLVLPTLADGFGQVVADALAHGLPVITTTNAGAADRITPGVSGFVVPPANVAALADRLAWCLDHPADLFAMREAALAEAGRWTWADFRRTFIARMATALAGRAAAAERATA
jgi:glycosyltransferase involved in cell wall biosynthesis